MKLRVGSERQHSTLGKKMHLSACERGRAVAICRPVSAGSLLAGWLRGDGECSTLGGCSSSAGRAGAASTGQRNVPCLLDVVI